MTDRSEWKKLRAKLAQQGCDIILSKNGHYKIYHGDRLVSTMSNSASDWRSLQNQRGQLKRKGFAI